MVVIPILIQKQSINRYFLIIFKNECELVIRHLARLAALQSRQVDSFGYCIKNN